MFKPFLNVEFGSVIPIMPRIFPKLLPFVKQTLYEAPVPFPLPPALGNHLYTLVSLILAA